MDRSTRAQRTRMARVALAGLVTLAAIAGCAAPGAVIRGHVRMPGESRVTASQQDAGTPRAETGAGAKVARKSASQPGAKAKPTDARVSQSSARRAAKSALPGRSVTETVIYIDRLEPRDEKRPDEALRLRPRATLALNARGFDPRVAVVARGESLQFANRDRRWHSPFSVSPARRFDLGSMGPGATRPLRFDRAGIVRVFCNLHADSSAFVFVAPNPIWVRPDPSGAFALPVLPPGPYLVRAWHPRFGERRWNVVLPRRGIAVDLGF